MTDSPKKILLVDDDRIILSLICKLLFRKGFECLKADSVDLALEILENTTPDIILSDYSMPDKDGFQFRQILLKNRRLKNIPFVFFTSFADNELMQKGLELKAIDYIDKSTPIPLVVSKLVNILDTVRKQHEQSIYEIGAAARALNLRSVPASVPRHEMFRFNFLYKTFENYPGGDFIDFIVTENGYTFIVLGDVMGKKWGAWFFSFNYLSYIRSAIRLCVFEGDLSTASIVNKINRVVNVDPVLKDVLAGLSLLMIEPNTGLVHYTGAGDLPVIIYRNNTGAMTDIVSSGLLLGIMPDGQYDEQVIETDVGDQLIVISDGMIDFKVDGGKMSDYQGFIERISPFLGKEDTFSLVKERVFEEKDLFVAVDDQSFLFIERKF